MFARSFAVRFAEWVTRLADPSGMPRTDPTADSPDWDWKPGGAVAVLEWFFPWPTLLIALILTAVGILIDHDWMKTALLWWWIGTVANYAFIGVWASIRSDVPLRMTYGGWKIDRRRLRRHYPAYWARTRPRRGRGRR